MDGDLSRSCEAPPLDAAETRKEWERRIRASKEADFDLEHQSQKHLRSCLQGLRKRSGDRDTSEPVPRWCDTSTPTSRLPFTHSVKPTPIASTTRTKKVMDGYNPRCRPQSDHGGGVEHGCDTDRQGLLERLLGPA